MLHAIQSFVPPLQQLGMPQNCRMETSKILHRPHHWKCLERQELVKQEDTKQDTHLHTFPSEIARGKASTTKSYAVNRPRGSGAHGRWIFMVMMVGG